MTVNKKNRILYNFWVQNDQVFFLLVFSALIIGMSVFLDKDFLTARNFNNLILNAFPSMMAAVGQMMVLLIAGMDLSLGSIISLCNVCCVAFMKDGTIGSAVMAVIFTLSIGVACGFVNGVLITKGRLSPVIVTIATSSVYNGLALWIQPIPGGSVVKSFARFLSGKLGFPTHILLLAAFMVLAWYITSVTAFGKRMRAVGSSEDAAYSTGISVNKMKMIVYMLAGCFGAIGAVFLTAQAYCGDANIGSSYTLNSITIAVIGGTLLTGAVGHVSGTVIGTFLLVILNNILNLSGVSSFYQYVFQGAILIVALAISTIRSAKR